MNNRKGSTECNAVPEAPDARKLVNYIIELQKLLEVCDNILDRYCLPYQGHLVRDCYGEAQLDDDTVFLLVTGTLL